MKRQLLLILFISILSSDAQSTSNTPKRNCVVYLDVRQEADNVSIKSLFMTTPGYKKKAPVRKMRRLVQFADHPVAIKLSGVIVACPLEDLDLDVPSVEKLIEPLFLKVIDGESGMSIARIPVSDLNLKGRMSISEETMKDGKWGVRFSAVIPLRGTWHASDLFIDHWLCFQVEGTGWTQRGRHGYKTLNSWPHCLLRWGPKNAEQRAQNQCMKARWTGSGHWGDPWKGSDEELFREKKRMYRRANEIAPTSKCGWHGIYRLYRKRGMTKEANAIMDEWKSIAPPEKHQAIEDIRKGRMKLH